MPEPLEGRRYVFSLAADGTVAAVSYADPTSSTTPVSLYRIPSGEVLTAFEIPSPFRGYTAEMLVGLVFRRTVICWPRPRRRPSAYT